MIQGKTHCKYVDQYFSKKKIKYNYKSNHYFIIIIFLYHLSKSLEYPINLYFNLLLKYLFNLFMINIIPLKLLAIFILLFFYEFMAFKF